MKNNKLGNPAALATITATKAGGKALENIGKHIPAIVISGLIITGIVFGPKIYRRIRRNSYAKNNLTNPNVQAAIIMRKAIKKIEFPGVLSWVLPDLQIWTNQNRLMEIAGKVTNISEVSKAYHILFESILLDDLQNGFSSKEFEIFFEIIQGKEGNQDIKRVILVGSKVYSVSKHPLFVKKARYDRKAKKWSSTNELYGTFNYKEEIGEVHAVVQFKKDSRFYIVKKGTFLTDYGLVWDNQITDIQ